jgi:hypothetical protein
MAKPPKASTSARCAAACPSDWCAFCQLGELRERDRVAVDERPRAALRVEHTAQQHLVGVARELVLDEPGGDPGLVAGGEHRRQLGPLRACAELPRLEAVAEQQRERVDEDRLARAGLAGQHGESGAELHVEGVDEDEVADR